MLDMLCSGLSGSAVGHEVSANESTVCILDKASLKSNTHKTRLYPVCLSRMLTGK